MKRAAVALAMAAACALVGSAAAAGAESAGAPAAASEWRSDADDPVAERMRALTAMEVDEVVWLARCIYSESDRPHEQHLVAWVVRNRVETKFRGETYREVVLEAGQFSAFNDPTPRRERILSLDPDSPYKPWQTALGIAIDVYEAPSSERPFPQTVRHFYSPISMRGGLRPHWADSGTEIRSASLGVDPFRFRFFNNVDEAAAEGDDREVRPSRGFLFPVGRPSGRVARPVRPSVRASQGTRGR